MHAHLVLYENFSHSLAATASATALLLSSTVGCRAPQLQTGAAGDTDGEGGESVGLGRVGAGTVTVTGGEGLGDGGLTAGVGEAGLVIGLGDGLHADGLGTGEGDGLGFSNGEGDGLAGGTYLVPV